MEQAQQTWIPVRIPNPPRWRRLLEERKAPGNAHMAKMREASARTHRINTESRKKALLSFLTSPALSFDGTNEYLARALTMSTRTVIRLMRALEADGKIKVSRKVMRSPTGYKTVRDIQVGSF